jgi:hypothetical protein
MIDAWTVRQEKQNAHGFVEDNPATRKRLKKIGLHAFGLGDKLRLINCSTVWQKTYGGRQRRKRCPQCAHGPDERIRTGCRSGCGSSGSAKKANKRA